MCILCERNPTAPDHTRKLSVLHWSVINLEVQSVLPNSYSKLILGTSSSLSSSHFRKFIATPISILESGPQYMHKNTLALKKILLGRMVTTVRIEPAAPSTRCHVTVEWVNLAPGIRIEKKEEKILYHQNPSCSIVLLDLPGKSGPACDWRGKITTDAWSEPRASLRQESTTA